MIFYCTQMLTHTVGHRCMQNHRRTNLKYTIGSNLNAFAYYIWIWPMDNFVISDGCVRSKGLDTWSHNASGATVLSLWLCSPVTVFHNSQCFRNAAWAWAWNAMKPLGKFVCTLYSPPNLTACIHTYEPIVPHTLYYGQRGGPVRLPRLRMWPETERGGREGGGG